MGLLTSCRLIMSSVINPTLRLPKKVCLLCPVLPFRYGIQQSLQAMKGGMDSRPDCR